MRILIIRHADPDYSVDGLTEKGNREAELLSHRLVKEDIKDIYCSELGRARLTIKPTLEKLNITATYCSWLKEFSYATVKLPFHEKERIPWDFLPSQMESTPKLYDSGLWKTVPFGENSHMISYYNQVCDNFDALLESYGYKRDGCNYKVLSPNKDTIVLTCHFGVAAVLLAHIMQCSPYTIWQHTVLLPTSITTIYTEEREEGIASLRCACIGDLSHLYVANEPPAFAARFCECFTDDTRH